MLQPKGTGFSPTNESTSPLFLIIFVLFNLAGALVAAAMAIGIDLSDGRF